MSKRKARDVVPDIVERLRAAGHDERLSTGALYLEAADEIARLRLRPSTPHEIARDEVIARLAGAKREFIRASRLKGITMRTSFFPTIWTIVFDAWKQQHADAESLPAGFSRLTVTMTPRKRRKRPQETDR